MSLIRDLPIDPTYSQEPNRDSEDLAQAGISSLRTQDGQQSPGSERVTGGLCSRRFPYPETRDDGLGWKADHVKRPSNARLASLPLYVVQSKSWSYLHGVFDG